MAGLLDALFGSAALGPIFTDRGRIDGMLRFEAALAAAEAKTGVIPAAAAAAIAPHCKAELYDIATLSSGVGPAGNTAIPLVRALTARVAIDDAEAARFVHWGATSQDVMDTGLVLQLRAALAWFDGELARLSASLADLATRHRTTPMIGRTWLQHALPVTFGLKAAGWLDAVERHRTRLIELRSRVLVLQFGGAAGTLAALGGRGLEVTAALAAELALGLPELPWHGQRDRLVELACVTGMIAGTMGKIARDISLLMQTDVGEAFEPAGHGRGGSSTMPHKRNPVAGAAILAAATRAPGLVATMLSAMPQEHERGLGGWHAEWTALPELLVLAGGALTQVADTIAGLEVDTARMRANIDATRGLVMAEAVTMALGARLGRLAAHERVEAACKRAVASGRHLREVLAEDTEIGRLLGAAGLDRLFDPLNYIGVAPELVDRALKARRS
jgi:3-carboxy-cis,cis-muconate cycloisomerase